jgi:hypothetical protein
VRQREEDESLEVQPDEFNATLTMHNIPTFADLSEKVPKKLDNWRDTHGFCQALCAGKLMETDYNVLIFLTLTGFFLTVMAVVSYIVTESLTYGTSIAVLVVIVSLLCLPLIEHF